MILWMMLVYSMVYEYRFWMAMLEKEAAGSKSRIEQEARVVNEGSRRFERTEQELDLGSKLLVSCLTRIVRRR